MLISADAKIPDVPKVPADSTARAMPTAAGPDRAVRWPGSVTAHRPGAACRDLSITPAWRPETDPAGCGPGREGDSFGIKNRRDWVQAVAAFNWSVKVFQIAGAKAS